MLEIIKTDFITKGTGQNGRQTIRVDYLFSVEIKVDSEKVESYGLFYGPNEADCPLALIYIMESEFMVPKLIPNEFNFHNGHEFKHAVDGYSKLIEDRFAAKHIKFKKYLDSDVRNIVLNEEFIVSN